MKKFSTYLTGPITLRHNQECREWRVMVTEKLKPLNIEALNPFNIEGNTDEIRQQIYAANQRGDLDTTRSLVSSHMINEDLKMVERATFLTVWIPKLNGYEICGSYGEVTLAYYLGKPVYVITERSLKPNELPSWLIGCSAKIFGSWDEYFAFVEKEYKK
jgi:hypothetical protein